MEGREAPGLLRSFALFFYSCFIKPHKDGTKATQQDALESFYKKQAGAYDATRKVLLRGREDMLALVAAQLESKADEMTVNANKNRTKRIWVDVSSQATYSLHLVLVLTLYRLVAALAGILRPWLSTSMSPNSSRAST